MLFSSREIPDATRNAANGLSARKRLPASVMLTGGTPSLREKCALELAMAVNCAQPKDGQPCGKCPDCIKAKAGSHPDIIRIVPENDKKKVAKDTVKDRVILDLYTAPNEAENKVYIFPEAQDLSPEIQNMLLKTVEEPPDFVMFIFECAKREDMLTTVISRCTQFPLGDAPSSKNTKDAEKVTAAACGILDALCRGTEFDLILATAPMHKNRALMKKTAAKIIEIVRDAMAESSGAELFSGCDKQAAALSIQFSTDRLLKIKDAMDEIIDCAEANANENLLISKFSSSLSTV